MTSRISSFLPTSFIVILFSFKPNRSIVTKLEMHLSAFGVESDDFPSIDVYIDFIKDSSNCHKWYYNPTHKDSTYQLSAYEIKNVFALLKTKDLDKMKTNYISNKSDQPTSISTIFIDDKRIIVKDYGLQADDPLKSIYKMVYKF